jgi:Antp family, other
LTAFVNLHKMNSYFEQSSFYGAQGSEQPYRFPLSLGMSPYAQHHHQSRPQDSPYDASASAAAAAAAAVASCKLYSSQMQSAAETAYKSAADAKTSSNSSSDHQNGYAAALAAATANSKSDIAAWPTASGVPVRPAACTPDRYSSGAGGANGLSDHPSVTTSPTGHRPLNWNNCSLNTTAAAVSQQASQLQQSSNHTFYPWMAIAGTGLIKTLLLLRMLGAGFGISAKGTMQVPREAQSPIAGGHFMCYCSVLCEKK